MLAAENRGRRPTVKEQWYQKNGPDLRTDLIRKEPQKAPAKGDHDNYDETPKAGYLQPPQDVGFRGVHISANGADEPPDQPDSRLLGD